MKKIQHAYAVVCADDRRMHTADELLAEGVAFHRLGRLGEAARLYEQTLSYQPDNADALNLLGSAALSLGQVEQAIALIERAVQLSPRFAGALSNLGNAKYASGKTEEAIACYREALELDPNNSEICYNLGNGLARAGCVSEAVQQFVHTTEIDPFHWKAWYSLGNAHAAQEDHPEAARCYERAFHCAPGNVQIINNYGVSLARCGCNDKAETLLRRALEICPNDTQTLNNFGSMLLRRQAFSEAIPVLERATQRCDSDPTTWANLALAYSDKHREQAKAAAKRAIALRPADAAGWALLGNIELRFGNSDEAVQAYRTAMRLDPGSLSEELNVGLALTNSVHLDDAMEFYRQMLHRKPEDSLAWADSSISLMNAGLIPDAIKHLEHSLELDPTHAAAHSNLLLMQGYSAEYSPERLLAEAKRWATAHGHANGSHTVVRERTGKLHIGYLSADFHQHPAGRLYEALFPHHDRDRFEFTLYANQKGADEVTRNIVQSMDRWHIVTELNDEQLVEKIRQDRVDVLVDLLGHTPNHRLQALSLRAAPVQATWLGYWGTTGLKQMDFIVADRWVLPEAHEPFYTERPALIEGCLYTFQPPKTTLSVNALPMLSRGYPTFGCFNNLAKISPEVVRLWSAVLRSVPESRLILNRWPFGSPRVCERYRSLFEANGVESWRIEFRATSGQEAYLRGYHDVDIMLDTLPFGGGTTTLECLWMGVPVVSIPTDRFAGRMTESILNGVGTTELLTVGEEGYVGLATRLATDPGTLSELRAGLRERVERSSVCDLAGFACRLQDTFEWMWANRRVNTADA